MPRSNFSEIVAFAKKHGFSVQRHPVKGFRVWYTEYPRDKHLNPVKRTLTGVKNFIEAEIQKENASVN
jgi:hypothetical protein